MRSRTATGSEETGLSSPAISGKIEELEDDFFSVMLHTAEHQAHDSMQHNARKSNYQQECTKGEQATYTT